MQGIDVLMLGHGNHGLCIEVTFVRRITTNADHGISFSKQVNGRRLHIRVRLHENDFDGFPLGHPYELCRRASPCVDEYTLNRAVKVARINWHSGGRNHGPFLTQDSGHHPVHHFHNTLARHGYVRIDPPKLVI